MNTNHSIDYAEEVIKKLSPLFFSEACKLISELTELNIEIESHLESFEVLKKSPVEKDNLEKKGIDYLGRYLYGSDGPKIELFAHNILTLAEDTTIPLAGNSLEGKIQSIARIVLLHEIAHYYTHKGLHGPASTKYKAWDAFDKAKECVKEALAQYWTDETLRESLCKEGAPDEAILKQEDRTNFDEIARRSPKEYRGHQVLRDYFLDPSSTDPKHPSKIAEGSPSDWIKMRFEKLKRSKNAGPKVINEFDPKLTDRTIKKKADAFYLKCAKSWAKFMVNTFELPAEQKPLFPRKKVPRP